MASSRIFLFLGSNRLGFQTKLLKPGLLSSKNHTASLTSVHHLEKKPDQRRYKPFPYEKVTYNPMSRHLDYLYGVFRTSARMGENSKVIVVEGQLATGKNELAKKLAQEFDMKYFPDAQIDDTFITRTGFDIREIDEELPLMWRSFDEEKFHTTTDPELKLMMGPTHMKLYFERFNRYCEAMLHLLSTGQGVVLARSCWSDAVFTETLFKQGYMTSLVKTYLEQARAGVEMVLWRPHLVIYLDAPVDYAMQQIKKRNRPFEAESKAFTKEYLEEIEHQYVNNYLKGCENSSIVVSYDVTDGVDFPSLVDDIEAFNYEVAKIYDDDRKLFNDWDDERQQAQKYDVYRMKMADLSKRIFLFEREIDAWRYMDNPEMKISGHYVRELEIIEQRHPEMIYDKKKYPKKVQKMKEDIDMMYY